MNFIFYLLKAKEQAAAEKQPVIHVPIVDKAGNAIQLIAAPIIYLFLKRRKKRRIKINMINTTQILSMT
jgi:hypothetical protein